MILNAVSVGQSWRAETNEALATPKLERLHLATGLLLPIWDKLPGDYVRVSRIAAKDGRSLLGREIGVGDIPELAKALGQDLDQSLDSADLALIVMKAGRPLPFRSVEALIIKRSLVNGNQRIELTGWSADRLDWYKARGCFTEIIRYQTRLFVPCEDAAKMLKALSV